MGICSRNMADSNNFPVVSFSFIVRENFLNVFQTSHIPRIDQHNSYFHIITAMTKIDSKLTCPCTICLFGPYCHVR